MENKKMKKNEKETEVAVAGCHDKKCHVHGELKTRGKIFEGNVIKKFPTRVVIGFERSLYVRKYERYKKAKTKLHAHLPDCMEKNIHVGDRIRIQECRPLSKIIHFAVVDKIKSGEEK
jgi:small subunit ribosomal protein S17